MSRKRIITILIFLIFALGLLVMVIAFKGKNKNDSTILNSNNQLPVLESFEDFEAEFNSSVKECKRLYKKMNYSNFDICFDLATIGVSLSNYLIGFADANELRNVNLYNKNGLRLENNLNEMIKDTSLESNNMTYDQKYFIYTYSKSERLTYFYTIMFNKDGDVDIQFIAYTDELEFLDEENS